MQLSVFDTWATLSNGDKMHFDVFLDSEGTLNAARTHAFQWLNSVGVSSDQVQLDSCQFCHHEAATPEIQTQLKQQRYAILQMQGCPAPY